jgi:hypothetical protein
MEMAFGQKNGGLEKNGRPSLSQPHFSQVCVTWLLSLNFDGDATVQKD